MPFPGENLFPGENVFPGTPTGIFNPPTEDYHVRLEGSLIATMQAGLDVWRDAAGAWHTTAMTSAEDRETAGRFYGGGRVHTLTDSQRSELITAGYGAYITYQEV